MIVVTSGKIRSDLQEQLRAMFQKIDFRFHPHINKAEKDLQEADVLITYGEDLVDRHIEEAANLKWIMVISAGLDQMPFKAIEKKKIIVTNGKGIHVIPMAEYTINAMLQISRQSEEILSNQKNKEWDRPIVSELYGKTIGILGAGAIGQGIAKLAKAFGMNVIGLNQSGKEVGSFDQIITYNELPVILAASDYIVSVLPKMKETDNMLSKKQFDLMKNDAVLINIGRGNVVNEADLLNALEHGQIKHAVLDVFNEEPLPKEHPFWESKSITVTPHLSGISPQYQSRALEIFEKNLEVFLSGNGKYINLIEPTKGY